MCLLQTVSASTCCVCQLDWVSKKTLDVHHTDTWGAYQRFSNTKDKITLSYEPKTRNGEKSKTPVQPLIKLWWEDRCTHNPMRERAAMVLSSTALHFTSAGSASVPTPRSQTELLIMWTHTWRAFITLCRCPTVALTITHPQLSHSSDEQSHESSTLYFIFKHCRRISRSRQFYRSLNNLRFWFETILCPVKSDRVSREEWGRVSSNMSWLAGNLWPQTLLCNLNSKWRPHWLSA